MLTYGAMMTTTSGGGGFVACHRPFHSMSTYEVFCGLLLLAVSFTIHTGRGLSARSVNYIGRRPPPRGRWTAGPRSASASYGISFGSPDDHLPDRGLRS